MTMTEKWKLLFSWILKQHLECLKNLGFKLCLSSNRQCIDDRTDKIKLFFPTKKKYSSWISVQTSMHQLLELIAAIEGIIYEYNVQWCSKWIVIAFWNVASFFFLVTIPFSHASKMFNCSDFSAVVLVT